MSGSGPAASRFLSLAGQTRRGLAGTLFAADRPSAWRSPWLRRAAHAAMAAATVMAGLLSVATMLRVTPAFFWLGGVTSPGPGTVVFDFYGYQFNAPAGFMPGAPLTLAVLVALAVVVPLPLAARYPLLGWRIGWLALLLVPLAGVSWWPGWPWGPAQILALLVVFCVAGVRHPRPVLWWMWALSLIPWWLRADSGRPGVLAAAVGTVAFTAVAVAVDAVGARRRAQQALAGQAELAELEQARRAVLEERAKIARELHDVVAHHMSLIAVRAETAPYRLDGLPEEVRTEFGSLSEAAREALADMRRLLGVLRHDQPAARAPQPQLSDLPTLIETARQAGVSVALSAPPALGQVPSGVGVCAYRIVQESLSNASRHAPGAPVTVSLDHAASAVLLQVANGPATPATPATANGQGIAGGHSTPATATATASGHGQGIASGPGGHSAPATATASGHGQGIASGPGGHSAPATATASGHGQGIAGMRERVALLGGALSAGPSPDGGFIVSAVLPLIEAA